MRTDTQHERRNSSEMIYVKQKNKKKQKRQIALI